MIFKSLDMETYNSPLGEGGGELFFQHLFTDASVDFVSASLKEEEKWGYNSSMSSVTFYWTDAQQHAIYLLNDKRENAHTRRSEIAQQTILGAKTPLRDLGWNQVGYITRVYTKYSIKTMYSVIDKMEVMLEQNIY